MPDTPLNPDALEAASRTVHPGYWNLIDKYPEERIAQKSKSNLIEEAHSTVSAYLAVAQPEVNSVEELDALPVGTVVLSTAYVAKQDGYEYPCAFQKLYTGEWHRGGRLSDTHPDYFLPARVLCHPEVSDA
ncbi:hypothetical protein ACT17S_11365 [Glutamicibacter mysorens]